MLADAGLLVHIFDTYEDQHMHWAPPPGGGERAREQSCSLVFAQQRVRDGVPIPLFSGRGGGAPSGLIFRPHVARILCGKPTDSAGVCINRYHRWCDSTRANVQTPYNEARDKLCSWRPADVGVQLQRLIEYQSQPGRSFEYNEFIVDGKHWRANLPGAVEAIFGDASTHSKFMRHYGLSAAAFPLFQLDVNNWREPIRRA